MTLNKYNFLIIKYLLLTGACLIAFGSNAYAAKSKSGPPWYEIEVIIFLNQLELGVSSENWEVAGPPAKNTVPISLRLPGDNTPISAPAGFDEGAGSMNMGGIAQNKAFVMLDRSEFQLNNIANKLANSANYKPLLHFAWRQPTLSQSESQPIYVFNGMTQIQPVAASQRNQFGAPSVIGASFEGPQIQDFSGTIRVSVSRYLHIETDLHLRAPVWRQDTVEVVDSDQDSSISSFFGVQPSKTTSMVVEREVITDFRLLETRRMRSTEVHYYDHPKFSVIVMATPYAIESTN